VYKLGLETNRRCGRNRKWSRRFPHTISVASRVIIIANKENFCPKTALQTVLCFDYSQIIASGDHAAVEHDQVVLARGEKDRLCGRAARVKQASKSAQW